MNRKKIDLEALLETAAAEFGREGFSGARMDTIASAAGVNKALIYYHLGDKKALFEAVVSRVIKTAVLEINGEEGAGEELSPIEYLETYMRGFHRFFLKNPDYPLVILRELLAGGVHLGEAFAAPLMTLLKPLIRQIEKGVELGLFKSVSPSMIHIIIVSGLIASILGSPLLNQYMIDIPEEDFIRNFFNILMNGIGVPDE